MKIPLLLGSLALAISTATVSAQTSPPYNGNGAGGFGGPVGGGMLSITNDPATGLINFQLTTVNGGTTDQIVFYFDSTTGGFNDTSTLTDTTLTTDAGRRAVTGTDGTSRSTVNFSPGFTADYGLDISGANSTLYQLTPGSLTYNSSPATTLNGNVYTFSINAATLGVAPGGTLNFVANLLNPYDGTDVDVNGNGIAVFRSNESFGTSLSSTGATNNPGTAGSLTFSNSDAYTLAVPEPSAALAMSAGASILGIGYLIRRRKQGLSM